MILLLNKVESLDRQATRPFVPSGTQVALYSTLPEDMQRRHTPVSKGSLCDSVPQQVARAPYYCGSSMEILWLAFW